MRRTITAGLAAVVTAVALAGCGGSGGADIDPIREGRSVYADVCSACHGSDGSGGVGPSLRGVLDTFPDCADQIEWISLGSTGWEAAYGDTYGATNTPVAGGMPAQSESLTSDEIRRAAAYQRVTYGGEDRDAALAGCGIAGD